MEPTNEPTKHNPQDMPFFINKLNNTLLGLAFEAEQLQAGRISIVLKVMMLIISAKDSKLLTRFAKLCLDFKKEEIEDRPPTNFGTFTNN